MPSQKSSMWNESESYKDPWTLREVRRITTQGLYNETPTYHTNIGFSDDGEFLIFATERGGQSAICKAHVASGDITQLTESIHGVLAMGGTCHGHGVHNLCIAPRTRWAVYVQGQSVRAVHLDTFEECILIKDIDRGWALGIPSVSCDETTVVVPLATQHPKTAAGTCVSCSYFDTFAAGEGMHLELWEAPLLGDEITVIYTEDSCRSFHCPHSPIDPDLLLLDRDFPPRYWGGSDGKTTRAWTLCPSTGALTELAPLNANPFQVHSCWTWDGQHVLYHGPGSDSGTYIGICDQHSATVREYTFLQAAHYGHVSAAPDRPAIILDGDISPNLLMWLHYVHDQPHLEVIAAHNSQWGPSQATYPHPLCDSTGTWLAFNVAQGGRSDVHVVRL
jgi:hypothetical protein